MRTFIVGGKACGKNSLAISKAKEIASFLGNYQSKNEKPIKIIYLMSVSHLHSQIQIAEMNKMSELAGRDIKKINKKQGILEAFSGNSTKDVFIVNSVVGFYAQEFFKQKNKSLPHYKNVIDELKLVLNFAKNVIFVSEFVFGDANAKGLYDEKFYEGLSEIHLFLAEECDNVFECSFGKGIQIK